jgi:hypothetical protein
VTLGGVPEQLLARTRWEISVVFGFFSFVLDIAFALFPLLVLIFGLLWRCGKGKKLWALKFIHLAMVSLFWVPMMGTRLYHKATNYHFLRTLQSDSVASIEIGGITLDKEQDIVRVVAALNRAVWHVTNHDVGGPYVGMRIVLWSGDVRTFRIGRYHGKEGALVEFFRETDSSSTREDGDAFVPDLPTVLEDVGYALPPAGEW